MSVTIDSLDIQIRSSAGSAAANIDALAVSLGNLRSNAKLTSVCNNLNKLKIALENMKGVSNTLYGLDKLANSMAALASVKKASGLNSTFNYLKKLPELIDSLDDSKLADFTVRMRQLAVAMSPLATRIGQIAAGFSKLPSKVSSTVSAVTRLDKVTQQAANSERIHGNAINAKSLNIATAITNIQAYIGVIQRVGDAISATVADAIEWDGIQFRFGRAFGEDAQQVYDWIMKINDTLDINVQQFMQYSSLYGSLLKGFGMQQKQVTAISVGLTELSYDIWAAYNDRYKTLEDASEAVRSAITGEIEPIRNAGIALTEASMQEYLDSIGKANVSIEKLTEAQKAEVRYAVMVDAAMNQGIVGTYARETMTAEGAVRSLSQQLKTLSQAFGSLFIPVLQAVLPYISAFVKLMTDAVQAVAAFFGISLFKIDWGGGGGFGGAADSLGDIASGADDATGALGKAGKAAKKLKDYTMGFDELNVISPPTDSAAGGSGGAGGDGVGGNGWENLDLNSLWDDSILAQATQKADEIKQKMLDFINEFKYQLVIIGGALATLGITKLLGQLGESLQWGDKFQGVLKTIGKVARTAIVVTVQFTVMTELLKGFIDGEGFKKYLLALFVGAIGTGILYSMWGSAGIVIGLSVTAAASLSAIIDNGGITNVESAVVALTGLASAIVAVALGWKTLGPVIKGSNLARALAGIQEGSAAARSGLVFLMNPFPKLSVFVGNATSAVAGFVGGITAPVWGTIAAVIAGIASAAYFLYKNWDEVTAAVKNFFKTNIVPKLEDIGESWDKIKDALSPLAGLFDGLWDAIEPFVDGVKEFFEDFDFSKALTELGKVVEAVGAVIVGVLGGAVAGAFNAAISVIEGFVQVVSGIVQIVSGVVAAVVALFSGDLQGAWDAVKQIGQGIVDVFEGLWDMTIGAVIEFVKGVIGWFESLYDELVGHSIVPDMIDAVVEWFLSLPLKIFGPVQDFIDGIIEKFKKMWSDIKSWFTSNVAPKFTSAYWKAKFDTIRQAISDKLDETKKAASDKWNTIKSWFNTNVAPKFTVAYWKGKFNTIKQAIGDKLTEFKNTANQKWVDIKSWFSTNVAPKLTLSYWLGKFANFKEGFVQTIKGMLNSGIDLINRFIGWLNSKMKFSWDSFSVGGKEIIPSGKIQLFRIPEITTRFADGGFIEDGLFTMNRGEIAGKFANGKSVVANNQMIVDGIAEGVYRAVVAAMNETGRKSGEQNVNVYLDGKQLYASVKKTEAERGMTLMGNQLGYSY